MTVSAAEIDRLLHWMPIILRAFGVSDWERTFCASMVAKSKAGRFTPTQKQAEAMRGIVDAYVRSTLSAEAKAGPQEADLLSLIDDAPPGNPLHPDERTDHGAG
jgi:hypothetical protein